MNPESTNKLIQDTNPDTPRVLYRGTTLIDITTALATGYYGGATIDITDIFEQQVLNPDIDVYLFTDSGAPSYNRSLIKCPYSARSAVNGSETFNVSVGTSWTQGSIYNLFINCWSLSSSTSNRFFYVIYSSSIVKTDVLNPLLSS